MIWRRWKEQAREAETRDQRIADLERREHEDRRTEARDLARRVAVAECDRYGHIKPKHGPAAEIAEITTWASLTPIRLGPYCTRCGANLSKEES